MIHTSLDHICTICIIWMWPFCILCIKFCTLDFQHMHFNFLRIYQWGIRLVVKIEFLSTLNSKFDFFSSIVLQLYHAAIEWNVFTIFSSPTKFSKKYIRIEGTKSTWLKHKNTRGQLQQHQQNNANLVTINQPILVGSLYRNMTKDQITPNQH